MQNLQAAAAQAASRVHPQQGDSDTVGFPAALIPLIIEAAKLAIQACELYQHDHSKQLAAARKPMLGQRLRLRRAVLKTFLGAEFYRAEPREVVDAILETAHNLPDDQLLACIGEAAPADDTSAN